MSNFVVLSPAEVHGGRGGLDILVRWAFEASADTIEEALAIAEATGAIQTGRLQGLYPQVVDFDTYMRLPVRDFEVCQMPREFRCEAAGVCANFEALLLHSPVAA